MANNTAYKRLRKSTATAQKQVETALRKRRTQAAAEIRAAARSAKCSTNQAVRNQLYKKLNYWYAMFAQDTNDILYKQVAKIAKDADYEAQADADHGGLMKFDKKRIEDYWSMLTPSNSRYLAATMTSRMADDAVRGLRQAFVETFRASQLEQWTAREVHKNLQSKWDDIAGNLESHRFVDAAGRPWSNAQYLNMLTRTALARVSLDSYLDTTADLGEDLVKIRAHGDNCRVCNAWNGLIVSISGKDPRFPALNQAIEAGWHHPNCDCTTAIVLPEIAAEEIDEQAGANTPKNTTNAEMMQRYNDKVAMKGIQREKGMTAAQAHNELIREKMRRELRLVGMSRIDDAVDSLPDDVLQQMQTDKVPRIELTKKNDKGPRNANSELGGVIHIDRNDDEGGTFKAQFMALQGKRGADIKKPMYEMRDPGYIDAVESKIRKSRNEIVAAFDDNGNEVARLDGDASSVTLTPEFIAKTKHCKITHNHPSGWSFPENDIRRYGESFSPDDVESACRCEWAELRVVTPKQIFIMRPPNGGWNSNYYVQEIVPAFAMANFKAMKESESIMTRSFASKELAQILTMHRTWRILCKELGIYYKRIKR